MVPVSCQEGVSQTRTVAVLNPVLPARVCQYRLRNVVVMKTVVPGSSVSLAFVFPETDVPPIETVQMVSAVIGVSALMTSPSVAAIKIVCRDRRVNPVNVKVSRSNAEVIQTAAVVLFVTAGSVKKAVESIVSALMASRARTINARWQMNVEMPRTRN